LVENPSDAIAVVEVYSLKRELAPTEGTAVLGPTMRAWLKLGPGAAAGETDTATFRTVESGRDVVGIALGSFSLRGADMDRRR
jgi:hypothetical protein